MRSTAIGRGKWLFVGHPDAGQRKAILYSVIVSCLHHGAESLAYLRDVLTRLRTMTKQDDLALLLPSYWRPDRSSPFAAVTNREIYFVTTTT